MYMYIYIYIQSFTHIATTTIQTQYIADWLYKASHLYQEHCRTLQVTQ